MTEERNDEIEKLYLENTISIDTIATKFGVTGMTIRNILRARGVQMRGPEGKKGRRKLDEMEQLSRLHNQIGQDVSYQRNKMRLSYVAFAREISMSKERLRAIELGVHDITISDLVKISDKTGYSLVYLVTERNVKAA